MWKVFLGIIVLITCIGCGQQDNLHPTSCKAQVVEKIVVVGCPIKKPDCEFSGEGFIPTKKLLECVKLQKLIIEECSQVIDEQVTTEQPVTTLNLNKEEK